MAVDPLNPLPQPKPPEPYGSTSVADRVTDLASKDSALNQMARTEAAKVMNRRGMLNSSMTAGAATDAVLKNVTPIASQDASQAFQGSQAQLNRELQDRSQTRDIDFRTQQGALDRALQEKLESWQLKSSDRNAAGQLLTNMESMYASDYQSIMANTNLDATTRAQQLLAAKQKRDKQINFVEQMYNIDLKW